ncbi:MAG: CoA transferase, partial [Pseudomonadota bacterium]|nr:CoA transferase [Pseudomonadota bacterium]
HPEWSQGEYATNEGRVAHRDDLVALIQGILSGDERDVWLARFEALGIPAGPIHTLTEVFADPQVQHRGMAREIDGVPQVANPLRFDGESATADVPPPKLGEHSERVLADMGLSADDIARLRREGIIR